MYFFTSGYSAYSHSRMHHCIQDLTGWKFSGWFCFVFSVGLWLFCPILLKQGLCVIGIYYMGLWQRLSFTEHAWFLWAVQLHYLKTAVQVFSGFLVGFDGKAPALHFISCGNVLYYWICFTGRVWICRYVCLISCDCGTGMLVPKFSW